RPMNTRIELPISAISWLSAIGLIAAIHCGRAAVKPAAWSRRASRPSRRRPQGQAFGDTFSPRSRCCGMLFSARIRELDPGGRVIARLFPMANIAINVGGNETAGDRRIQIGRAHV